MDHTWNPADIHVETERVGAYEISITTRKGEEPGPRRSFGVEDPESGETQAIFVLDPCAADSAPVQQLRDLLQPGWRAFARLDTIPHFEPTVATMFVGVRVQRAERSLTVYFPAAMEELPSLHIEDLNTRIDGLLRGLNQE